MDQPPKITRANLDMTPFMVKHGQPKKQPHRDQFTVRLSFGGLVEDNPKPLKLNRAVWRAFLRALKLDPMTAYFERTDVKMAYKKLQSMEPPIKDPEAEEWFRQVVAHFSHGRPVSVVSEHWGI